MVILTRQQTETVFQHIIRTVGQLDVDTYGNPGNAERALAQSGFADDIHVFMCMTDEDILDLEFVDIDENGDPTSDPPTLLPLNRGTKRRPRRR